MKIFNTILQLKQHLQTRRASDIIKLGFVPTMGALHQGHLSLVKKSVAETDITVCSILVNPYQFDNPKDLENYPRKLEDDLSMLENSLCDIAFVPTAEDVFSVEMNTSFNFGNIENQMEGMFRKGHFEGVIAVVSRLFKIVEPDVAYFGEKDFQQLYLIKRMSIAMGGGVRISGCETIRESNGLAMSSRNSRMSIEEKNIASQISAILNFAMKKVKSESPEELKITIKEAFSKQKSLRLEYFEIVDENDLTTAVSWKKNVHYRACAAVWIGPNRLIDNVRIR